MGVGVGTGYEMVGACRGEHTLAGFRSAAGAVLLPPPVRLCTSVRPSFPFDTVFVVPCLLVEREARGRMGGILISYIMVFRP